MQEILSSEMTVTDRSSFTLLLEQFADFESCYCRVCYHLLSFIWRFQFDQKAPSLPSRPHAGSGSDSCRRRSAPVFPPVTPHAGAAGKVGSGMSSLVRDPVGCAVPCGFRKRCHGVRRGQSHVPWRRDSGGHWRNVFRTLEAYCRGLWPDSSCGRCGLATRSDPRGDGKGTREVAESESDFHHVE